MDIIHAFLVTIWYRIKDQAKDFVPRQKERWRRNPFIFIARCIIAAPFLYLAIGLEVFIAQAMADLIHDSLHAPRYVIPHLVSGTLGSFLMVLFLYMGLEIGGFLDKTK